MASGTGLGQPTERRGMNLPAPGRQSELPAKDALYRETLQTTGRTTRILHRPKRVCIDRQLARPCHGAVARRQCALLAEPRALNLAFFRHDGIYRSDVVGKTKPPQPGGGVPPPVGRPPSPSPRMRRKERILLIVRDEFRPAIPRSGCSPAEPVSASPAPAEYHALLRGPGRRGHFYFARKGTFLLCLDTRVH